MLAPLALPRPPGISVDSEAQKDLGQPPVEIAENPLFTGGILFLEQDPEAGEDKRGRTTKTQMIRIMEI
jgi:hypothetical protein